MWNWSGLRVMRKRAVVAGIVVVVGIMAFGAAASKGGEPLHETIEWIGLILIVTCMLGRTWCSIYIGGKKNAALTRIGPYSICRNPLYFFSTLGAAGVGAQIGSVTVMIVCGLFTWVVQFWLVLQEEKYLAAKFGKPYRDYCARVPRFIPRPWLWHGPDLLEIRVSRVVRTFLDACLFLLAVPWAETYEYLQNAGYIPVYFHLF
ncbi:MAG: methyltransferase family protein [Pseudolabrys sp.]